MDLALISLWLAVGLLGSLLGRNALSSRFPGTDAGKLNSVDFVLAVGGPFNLLAVLGIFGKDCFKRF